MTPVWLAALLLSLPLCVATPLVLVCCCVAVGSRQPRHSSHGLGGAGGGGGGLSSQKNALPHQLMFQPTGYTTKPPPHRIPQMQTLAPSSYGPRQHTPTEGKLAPPRIQEVCGGHAVGVTVPWLTVPRRAAWPAPVHVHVCVYLWRVCLVCGGIQLCVAVVAGVLTVSVVVCRCLVQSYSLRGPALGAALGHYNRVL